MIRIIGLVVFAVGVTLLLFGYNASQAIGDQIVERVTGRFTQETMAYLIGGVAAIVGGGALLLWGGRRVKT